MSNILEKLYCYVVQYGLTFIYALLIFFIGKWIAKLISRISASAMAKASFNETLASFFKNIIYYGILAFVVTAALNKLGIETTSFVAIMGAAGLAVGLALQGSLANFAAGVMLIIFHPIRVGDKVEAGGASGTVKEIQIFSTVLETKEKNKVIVPNSKITGDKITIFTA